MGWSARYIYYKVCTSRIYYCLLLSMSDSLLSEQTYERLEEKRREESRVASTLVRLPDCHMRDGASSTLPLKMAIGLVRERFLVLGSRQRFCENIGDHFICGAVQQFNYSGLDFFRAQNDFDIKMFGSCVILWIPRDSDGRLIILEYAR